MISCVLSLGWALGHVRPATPAPLTVIEMPIEKAGYLSVEAVIRSPDRLNEREEVGWKVLERSLLQGTRELTTEQLWGYGSLTGRSPSIQAMDDWMSIRLTVPAGEIGLLGQMIESILVRADLSDESLNRVRSGLQARVLDPWREALQPSQPRFTILRNRDVRELYGRIFRPENVRLVLAGEFEAGAATTALQSRFAGWKPRPVNRTPWTDTKPTQVRSGSISSFELAGPVLRPADPSTPATMLAVFALGVGKEGSLFRVVRSQMKLSYRQDAILWPTSSGWQPRLLMLRQTREDEIQLPGRVREALLKDVETWTDAQLERSMAMAEASLLRGMILSPFWLSAYGPEVDRGDFAVAWAAYQSLTGSPWSTPELLISSLQSVELDQLKLAAQNLLNQANVRWIRGSQPLKSPDPQEPGGQSTPLSRLEPS
ncbi:MAG TPA: hypothetical protein PLO61_09845 [Fimbriimonadaceae bacterium]|nr:hypothetical protein [Fimbriimonadaceae bacterium]HRJ32139.1 hypothetical protein [Fimbriimonadaceae bacterium]